ncbi:PTS lactose/cellobiose transporter subunit IIA [Listeria costaricensis]|uniref:PTS lactose/cellobiose transporter subunit IIA n=1 Tax=Listeria costaricensis TaxID=2026604 RepID=UPI000C06C020|nr:PTS lactose/cellobiose transporter subunit IIA [Listeria costaricensis]
MEIQTEEAVVKLILHGGNVRKEAYTAIDAAENYQFKDAEHHLHLAEEEFKKGHVWQTKLVALRQEQVHPNAPSFLLIHGQDHIMTAQAELNLAKRIIHQYQVQAELEERISALEYQQNSQKKS